MYTYLTVDESCIDQDLWPRSGYYKQWPQVTLFFLLQNRFWQRRKAPQASSLTQIIQGKRKAERHHTVSYYQVEATTRLDQDKARHVETRPYQYWGAIMLNENHKYIACNRRNTTKKICTWRDPTNDCTHCRQKTLLAAPPHQAVCTYT